jgi:hypothetical protein
MKRAVFSSVLFSALLLSGCQTKTAPQNHSNTESTKERSSEWIWSENVEFSEYHDVMQIYLVDGRQLQVALSQSTPSAVEWSEVNQWKRGRALRIAFSATDGATLIDVETFSRMPIIGGLGLPQANHPLDRLLQQNLEISLDTISIENSYSANTQHWETEIDRIYEVAAEEAQISEAVRSAHVGWKSFQKNQIKASAALHSLATGTIWRIQHAEFVHKLTRSHALQLMSLLEPFALGSLAEDEQNSAPSTTSTP